MRKARGFSLIELLVVVVVVSTAVAVAVPAMSERDAAYRLDLSTRRVHEDLTHARTTARFESRPVSITFDAVLGSYYTWPGQPAGVLETVDPIAVPDLDTVLVVDNVIDRVVSVSSNTRLAYSASGDVLARQVNLAGSPFKAMLLASDFGGETTLTFDGFGVPVSAGTVLIGVRTRATELAIDANSGSIVLRDLGAGEVTPLVNDLNTAQDAAGDTDWTALLEDGIGNPIGDVGQLVSEATGLELVGGGG